MQKPKPTYVLDLVFHPEHDGDYTHFENAAAHPFQPDPAAFPRVNVWWLADSALLTYWDKADAKAIFNSAGLESKFIKVGSTDCYVAWQDTFVIVAFRGTEPDEWKDVLADAKIELVPWPTGKVHRGFKEALDDIWPTLEAELASLSTGRKVWFCGHSLGAALATLAADRYSTTRGVCTFGCPRVGDETFAAAFDAKLAQKTFRYVNHHDVVTHVPPPVGGYKHVNVRRFIASDGKISGTPPALAHFFGELVGSTEHLLEILAGLRAGLMRGSRRKPPTFLLDHMPKAYAIWTWNDFDANG